MPNLSPNTQLGPYTILEMLPTGKGGMARVYKANWQPRGQSEPAAVVVKVANTAADGAGREMTPQELEAFYYDALNNEVEVLKALRHPNIVRLYPIPWDQSMRLDPYIARATRIEGMPWFCAMEYLGGGSLNEILDKQNKLEPRIAIEIAYQMASALDYMHSRNYAHLDVKPDNILLRRPLQRGFCPEAVLIDFGIARRKGQRGLEAGSLHYMPPERVQLMQGATAPEKAADAPPVDVYAVGVLLYQMLTGHLPFGGHSKSSITSSILKSEPVPPSRYNGEVAGPLEKLVLSTLAKDPVNRPTAHQVVLRLDEALPPPRFSKDGASAPLLVIKPASPWPARILGATTTVFLATTVVEGAMLTGLISGRPTPPPIPTPAVPVVVTTSAPTIAVLPTAIAVPTTPPPTSPPPPTTVAPTMQPTEAPKSTVAPLPSSTAVPTKTPAPTRTPAPTLAPTTPPTPAP
ncbi:MAG: serine/threonine-protein kinase [Chloroflexi bacterium]|nr:serine/threonine-protein kinase [Chloroflexota bacterium]